jgi:HD-like signal output (HDOD) protein
MATFIVALLSVAALLGVASAWHVLARRSAARRASPAEPQRAPADTAVPRPLAVASRPESLRAASVEATQRLWRYAFGASAAPEAGNDAHASVRESVMSTLQAAQLDSGYFPRRPALIPQLLHASRDLEAGPAALARIIAQDPVLAGDVLRLANSSYYRITPEPVETVQRAIVVCGVDGLQGLIATALMRPILRAKSNNFPRFPELLWERSARAAAAAERLAVEFHRQDRFEAQLLALLSALGPLVAYRATLEQYARTPELKPSPQVCASLVSVLGPPLAHRVARDWQSAPRLVAVLDVAADAVTADANRPLALALYGGELLGTLTLLADEQQLSREESLAAASAAGLPAPLVADVWERLHRTA